jgi:hypothetical protein
VKRLVVLALVAACGGAPPARPAPKASPPAWADVFEGTPDLYAVIRPRALKRDPFYGSFWKALVRAAQARGIAQGDTMVEAVEGSDEIVLGLNRGLDAALVLRGVPANLDPQTITDADGRSLFRPMNDRSKVIEYELTDRRDVSGGLFLLPDRTWVGALGDARVRARHAFAVPLNRPVPAVDADALISVRFGGLLAHALDGHAVFGPLGKYLTSATFSLERGKSGLAIGLLYEEATAAKAAAAAAKRIAADLAKEDRLVWLQDTKVVCEGTTVSIRVGIPSRLLEELPNAKGADLGL